MAEEKGNHLAAEIGGAILLLVILFQCTNKCGCDEEWQRFKTAGDRAKTSDPVHDKAVEELNQERQQNLQKWNEYEERQKIEIEKSRLRGQGQY